MLLRPGDILSGRSETYQIAATISRGAYGCVFRARTETGEWRVVKQFEPSEELSAEDLSYQRTCFEREARILSQIRSPLAVRGYELIQRDGDVFFVMEHVQGQTLRALFDQHLYETGEPYDSATVLSIGQQLCEVMQHLHELPEQVIYRDLKPSNLMWDGVGHRLRLIDFGAARFNADGRRATQGLGTEGYAPPELYQTAADLTPATDIYTVGAVLYELATGEPPGRVTPDGFRGYEESLPTALKAALLQALQRDPASRFASAREMQAALTATDPPAPLELAVPPRNSHPLLACYCPYCETEPRSEHALYCAQCGGLYQVAMLQIVPRYRPPGTVYLDRHDAVLGRSDPDRGYYPEIDLAASDPARHVSRRHATLTREGNSFQLTIHPTTNPTRLDGRLVEPSSSHPIQPGTRIELGDLLCVLRLKPILDPPYQGESP